MVFNIFQRLLVLIITWDCSKESHLKIWEDDDFSNFLRIHYKRIFGRLGVLFSSLPGLSTELKSVWGCVASRFSLWFHATVTFSTLTRCFSAAGERKRMFASVWKSKRERERESSELKWNSVPRPQCLWLNYYRPVISLKSSPSWNIAILFVPLDSFLSLALSLFSCLPYSTTTLFYRLSCIIVSYYPEMLINDAV